MVWMLSSGAPGSTPGIGRKSRFSGATMPLVTAGRLKLIGVSKATRMALIGDVPTIAEQGVKGFESGTYQGVTRRLVIDRTVRPTFAQYGFWTTDFRNLWFIPGDIERGWAHSDNLINI